MSAIISGHLDVIWEIQTAVPGQGLVSWHVQPEPAPNRTRTRTRTHSRSRTRTCTRTPVRQAVRELGHLLSGNPDSRGQPLHHFKHLDLALDLL